MKLKLFFIFYIFFITQSFVNANANIVFIDTNFILNSSLVGKSINEQLKNIDLKNTKSFDKIETNLKLEESKIISQKNVLDVENYTKKVNEFKIKVNKHNIAKKKAIIELKKKRYDAEEILKNILGKTLAIYAEKNSISLIISKESILIGKKELDITSLIIKELNLKTKLIDIK